MRVLSFDQSMHSTGWAFAVKSELQLVGLIETPKKRKDALTGIDAMLFQRMHISNLIGLHKPDVVSFEGIHQRRNVSTALMLSGLLYILMAMCKDSYQRYEIVTSSDVNKHLHLSMMTGRKKKGDRTIAFAREIMFGSIDGTDDPDPQADIASAVILCNALHVKLGLPRLAPTMKQVALL